MNGAVCRLFLTCAHLLLQASEQHVGPGPMATQRKEEGNALTKLGDWQRAATCYERGLALYVRTTHPRRRFG